MQFCTSCGHEIGVGRFCTNCGHAVEPATPRQTPRPTPRPEDPDPDVDGSTGPATAERRAVRRHAALEPMPPRTPPAAAGTPRAPRFPLFADEVGTDLTTATGTHRLDLGGEQTVAGGGASLLDRLTTGAPAPAPARDPGTTDHLVASVEPDQDHDPSPRDGRRGRRWRVLLVLLLVAAVLAAAVLGWRSMQGPDGGTASDGTGSATDAGAEARDLTGTASATVPGTAPPATEVGGGRATFEADHLLDGDPRTAWRVAGSAQGEEIVLSLPEAVSISRVGLVNGYAKRATDEAGQRFDWYHGNRRVTAVTWVFDTGTGTPTEVEQDLSKDRQLQLIDVGPVTTDTVVLRLRTVSDPGAGRAGRDFTAIGDVALIGTPAS